MHRLYRSSLLAGVGMGAFAALLVPLEATGRGALGTAFGGFLHVAGFAMLAGAAGWLLPGFSRGIRLWVTLAVLAAGVEILQPWFGRSTELSDWLYGLAGSGCVCGLWRARRRKWLWGLMLCGAAAFPFLWEGAMWHQERGDYPELAPVDARWSRRHWTENGVAIRWEGNNIRLELLGKQPERYPGVFRTPAQADWRACRGFRADLFWPSAEPAVWGIRIDDQPGNPPYAERFQQDFSVTQGWNTLRIPAADLARTSGGRPMRLDQIHQWGLFLVSEVSFPYVLLGAVRLELQQEPP